MQLIHIVESMGVFILQRICTLQYFNALYFLIF